MPLLTNWSYSRYGTWKKCPALLRYQILDPKIRIPHPAAARGTDIHATIENYLLGTGDLIPELEYYRGFLDGLRELNATPELRLSLDPRWLPCEWDDDKRWWRGVLDCALETPDHTVIYDWKTGQEYPDHREQREIYAAAYHSVSPSATIDVMHVYVDKKQNTITTFTEEDIPKLKLEWEDRANSMLNDRVFAPNPGFYCRTCPYSKGNHGPCVF